MSWTNKRIELLKKLWSKGLSCSQIAAELGGITRNAVISKVRRLGLGGRAKAPADSTRERPHKPRSAGGALRMRRPAIRGNSPLALAFKNVEPKVEEDTNMVIPLGQRRTILELTSDTCHWPGGNPGDTDFFFCGGKSIEALPYCAHHARKAYRFPDGIRADGTFIYRTAG